MTWYWKMLLQFPLTPRIELKFFPGSTRSCTDLHLCVYLTSIPFIPQWRSGEESASNSGDARDLGSIPGLGRSPGTGSDKPLQCSCLENLMARGAWWATVHGVTHSWTCLKRLSSSSRRIYTHICLIIMYLLFTFTHFIYFISCNFPLWDRHLQRGHLRLKEREAR